MKEFLNGTYLVRLKGWVILAFLSACCLFALAGLSGCKTLEAAKDQTGILAREADEAGAAAINREASQARGKLDRL